MRFVLDQDVDARVAGILSSAGHEVWTVAQAGLSEAADDDLTLYAEQKKAVLVTHDQEFSRRRRKNPIGRHLQLECRERMARDVVAEHLGEIVEAIAPFDDVWVRASVAGVISATEWN